MIISCESVSEALDQLRAQIACEAVDERTVLIQTGHFFADGDGVELLVRPSVNGEYVVVSDGGVTHARMSLYVDTEPGKAVSALWDDVKSEFGVEVSRDRIYVRMPTSMLASAISVLADACIAMDSARMLAVGERRTFSDELREWLASEVSLPVSQSQKVPDRFGDDQTVTAIVETRRGEVVLQAAGGTSGSARKQAFQRAFWVMSNMGESIPVQNRLVVVERPPRTYDRKFAHQVETLAQTAYVGSFTRQRTLEGFLRASEAPEERDLVMQTPGQLGLASRADWE